MFMRWVIRRVFDMVLFDLGQIVIRLTPNFLAALD